MITISGEGLTLEQIAAVAGGAQVRLTDDPKVLSLIEGSVDRVREAIEAGEPIYGVSTLYGGMADQMVPIERMVELQHMALWHHKTATGPRLSTQDVRAAMLLRANSLAKGYSSVRVELIERYVTFLNKGVTPHVFKRGSIGASGDLCPLSYIAGSIIGLDERFLVEFEGEDMSCLEALKRIGLEPLQLLPKEGLAMNNGTTASTGVAANNMVLALDWTTLAFATQGLFFQALLATDHSFDPVIHQVKPHPGQIFVADQFRRMLGGSALIRTKAAVDADHKGGDLIQDRYSFRCLPQYTGPIIESIANASRQITIEANSANDNPLINPITGEVYHTGNFLAQYTAIAMDDVRLQLAMMVKHLDVQVALLATPEFSKGLAPSLVGNQAHGLNLGLKSLQVQCNSIGPLVQFYAHSMASLYATHAEQFNQNINSQALNAANLTRDSIDLCQHFLACALVFAIQGVELRSAKMGNGYDASASLSEETREFYRTARTIAAGEPTADRPMIWDDMDGFIDDKVANLLADIAGGGKLLATMGSMRRAIGTFCEG